MKTLFYFFFTLILSFCINSSTYSQELTTGQKNKITSEIATAFEKSIKAAEKLDASMLADCVDDSLQAGFIVSGQFIGSFNEVMKDFREKAKGYKSQKMNLSNKKITVLADNAALVTASGDYSLALEDGRVLTGRFTWTIVYSKVNGIWKIIHLTGL